MRHRLWLTRSGIVAAVGVGGGVLWGAGPPGLALLVFFFVSSSVLTTIPRSLGGGDADRNGRTASQVFANAGVATLAAVAVRWCAIPSNGR